MLSTPCAGWTTVKIGDYESPASYLTNVADDILEALIRLYNNDQPATVMFDAEGFEYYIVIDFFSVFIIECKDAPVLYSFNLYAKNIAYDIIDDIEINIDEWAKWNTDCINDELETLKEKKNLEQLISELKQCIINHK